MVVAKWTEMKHQIVCVYKWNDLDDIVADDVDDDIAEQVVTVVRPQVSRVHKRWVWLLSRWFQHLCVSIRPCAKITVYTCDFWRLPATCSKLLLQKVSVYSLTAQLIQIRVIKRHLITEMSTRECQFLICLHSLIYYTCSKCLPLPTNQHSTFYRPDALPVAQQTVSKHWRELCQMFIYITERHD